MLTDSATQIVSPTVKRRADQAAQGKRNRSLLPPRA